MSVPLDGGEWVVVLAAASGVVVLTFAITPRVAAWLRLRWHGRRRRRRR